MKNGMIFSPEPKFSVGSSKALSNGSSFQKIDFHLARKPYTGIGNGDFRLETLNPNISSDSNKAGAISGLSSAMSGNKSDGSEVCDNGLDPELSFEITFRRIGAGLENLGNTCFLNSVLQCLTYTEPLAAYLQSGKHQNSCRIAGFCALCAIQKHVSRALQSSGRILTPKDLVSNLRCISRNFRNSRQEDAHECMVSLLESMHKCCLPSGVPSESPGAYEKSLVHKIFGGRLRSQVKCMQCSYCSNTYDPFLDLSLEIVRADSVHKALMHFTATEQLDGGERQYQCQSCKQKVKALKQLTVYKAPYVLTVHLKRFRAHDPGQKIDKKVQFGPSLDLKPFFSGSHEGNLTYTLYGVLVHAGGTTHSGHYYCFVRTSSGMWYSLDDNRVFQVSERTVLEQKAYMLFYYRDRGIVASKKPVLGIQKENVAANGFRNKMVSIPNQSLKGTVQNGFFEKRFGGLDTSAAVTQSDVLNIVSVKETLQNETSTQKSNGPTMASNSDTQVESLIGPVSKVRVKEISVQNPKGGESLPLPLSLPSAQGSGDNSNFCNDSSASTVSKLNGCSEERSSRDDSSVAVSIRPILSSPQNPAFEKLVIDKTSKKRNSVSEIGVPSKLPFGENDGKSSGLIGSTKSPKEPNNENSQVEGPSNGKATGASHTDNAAHSGMKLSVNGLAESSSSSITTDGSLHPNATNESLHVIAPDQKPHLKLKKKFLKYRVVSLHLGSNILFGSPFLRKKKKHKCSRKRTLGNETFNLEQLEEIDLGPSTSEKTGATYPSSTRPRKKKVKSCSTDQDIGKSSMKEVPKSNGDLSLEIKGEFNNRTDHNGALPATDKSPDESSSNSSCLAANQCDARKPDGLKNASRASMQNGLMSMLTRGLEETIVARWDGIDLPPYQEIESRVLEADGIGYVADEWDEEYDRGKRKKVRHSTDDFGGSNPFQEIATKKAQSKKARIERLSSGNQPFRI